MLKVDVVDSEKQIFSGDVEHLVAPGLMGELGIYPNHIPIITKLKPGVLRLQIPNTEQQTILAISGGFLEMQDNHATILADIVERTDESDRALLEQQKAEALDKLKHADPSEVEAKKAQASLEIAIAQLKALDYVRKHK